LKDTHPDRHEDHLFDFDPKFLALGNTTILPLDSRTEIVPEFQHVFSVVIADLSYMVRHNEMKIRDKIHETIS